MGEIAFLPLELNKQMDNWIYWCFCTFRGTWAFEVLKYLPSFPCWLTSTNSRPYSNLSVDLYAFSCHIILCALL